MMGDLENLLSDIGPGITDDLKFWGTVGLGAVGGHVAWRMAQSKLDGLLKRTVEENGVKSQVDLLPYQDVILNGAAILAGVFVGNYMARQQNPHLANVGRGLAVGIVAIGATGLLKRALPKEMGAHLSGLASLPPFRMPSLAGAQHPAAVGVRRVLPPQRRSGIAGLGMMPQQYNTASVLA